MKYTEKQLWEFVYRADTPSKIAIAEKWLKEHITNNDLFDDLMVALSIQSRNYYRMQSGRSLY